jgi:hypothetical protein
MKGKNARNKLMQGNKAQIEAGKCKKPSKKVPVLWLVVVPKYTPGHSKIAKKGWKCRQEKTQRQAI